jgi:hypothetical protein
MSQFDLPAWPQIWELLKQALDRVLSDIKNRNTKAEILKYLISSIIIRKKQH